jgi:cobalt-zinc-cadmium efflux system outer membrane protein
VDTQKVQAINPLSVSLQLLIDSANINKGDMRIAKDNLELSQANYSLQKAIAVPDINAALGYDRQGSYIPNFNSIGIAIDIPIFNRNQGNIRYSRIMVDYNKTQLDLTHKTLEEQVTRGFQKAIDADKLYKEIDPSFAGRFNDLAKSMAENYMKRNVNLLNFLNFYDSYKQNIVQLNTILFNRVNALENLNYLTGTSFFNN